MCVQTADQRKDRFGQVSGGHVLLWGFIFKVRLYKTVQGRYSWRFEQADLSKQEMGKHMTKVITREGHTNVYLDCPDDDNTDRSIFKSDDIYCLPVALGERLDSEYGKYMFYLLLQRELYTLRTHGFGTFRRIGLTKLSP